MIPGEIVRIFDEAFERWEIHLPPEDAEARRRGSIQSAGWAIDYLFGADEQGEYLDYYASHRLTNDRHMRIRASGELETLETPEEHLVYPSGAAEDEKQRLKKEFRERNQRIYTALRQKGFGG